MFRKIFSRLFKLMLFFNKNIKTHGKISIIKKPIINIKNGCLLELGNGVKLNSDNLKYHLNMYTPVKLYADREGAKIIIKENTRIHGSCIHSYEYIEIGRNCLIAANCQIFDGSGHDLYVDNPQNRINTEGNSKPIIIGDNCWIGANSIILPGSRLGNNCVVSAGSIVRGIFVDNSLISGNPAKIVKELT
ncbi:acyltransferase [Halarcobacter ebronensis]|uniref:Acetyltransferase n=1 Tax=Halarcobacter ebronensis TaxID=1462615 RepID=A0A4Q1AMC4_9BACT|nr:acyltransferase [Halarcobacter ebronensis]QKF81101.1 acyltransferase [Halarcobacter ebronensis]RXK06405.1 acetyltransferase [Halarcobacter ebronensis]